MEKKVWTTQTSESSMACWQHLDMACPYKWCYQPQHMKQQNQCNGHGWKIILLVFDINNSRTIQVMLTITSFDL
jgi:hypothetical protein